MKHTLMCVLTPATTLPFPRQLQGNAVLHMLGDQSLITVVGGGGGGGVAMLKVGETQS